MKKKRVRQKSNSLLFDANSFIYPQKLATIPYSKEHINMKETLHEFIAPYLPAVWKSLLAYLVVFLAIVADLYSGIRKAKEKGIYLHTYGLDRTMDKLRKRYNLLLVFSLLDALIIISEINESLIPYATLIASGIMCLVEIKSILEKDEDKGRYIEAAKLAKTAWQGVDKNELADLIIKKMENKKDETNI